MGDAPPEPRRRHRWLTDLHGRDHSYCKVCLLLRRYEKQQDGSIQAVYWRQGESKSTTAEACR